MNKIYVRQLNTHHNILEKINNYYYKNKQYTLLFSDKGMFHLENKEIYKLNITDGEISKKHKFYKDIDLWIDSTKFTKNSNIQQLPYDYYSKKIKELHFRLHENATITFCVELSDNKISNYYFITNENIENYSMKKDIVTFLSLLK